VNRNLIPLLVFLTMFVGVVLASIVYLHTLAPRYAKNDAILHSASDIKVAMQIAYDRGPLRQETWTMRDRDGLSTLAYRALGRNGVQVTISERPSDTLNDQTNVSFLFGKLVQDGLWDLPSKPPRGDTNAHYTISVYQLITNEHGGRTFGFTDPHYWATTGGHQFTIHLEKDKPVPDLLRMSSTTLVEPRYGELVDDFRSFGPQSFRTRIASEKKRRYGVAAS
jgi:hypothetical protein